MQEYIRSKGVTPCPTRHAAGLGLFKATAFGFGKEETAWLVGKVSPKTNDENLAKAKLLTMLEDLSGKGRCQPSERLKYQNDARRWFFDARCREDFESWCDTAGYDPDYIRGKAREVETNGIPQWRAVAGQGATYAKRKAYRERTGR